MNAQELKQAQQVPKRESKRPYMTPMLERLGNVERLTRGIAYGGIYRMCLEPQVKATSLCRPHEVHRAAGGRGLIWGRLGPTDAPLSHK
jgi:hypothetical protein